MQKIHFLKLILISLVITLTANANDAYKHDELDTKSRDLICNIDNLPSLVQYYGSRIQNVGVLYLSWKRCGVNFDKALSYNMQLSLLQKLPMYDFSVVSIGDINQRYFIHKHNGDYAKEIFDLEYNISTYLKKYSSGLGLLRSDFIQNLHSKNNHPMINGHGSGDRDHCVLDFDNILPVIQYLHPTNEEDVTVVDIGSGWGSCARQLALLGYKVYSIDLEPEHIEWQKQHFCSMPPFDTFIYKYWQMEKPEMLEEEQFQRYCSTVAKTNIKYISGNFADKKILEQIPDSKWNIVLALNSLQFFNKTDLHLTLNTINEYLDNKGLFIAVTKGKDQYYYSHDIYDFDISNYLGTLFKNYVILTAAFDRDIGRFRIVTLYKNNTK